MDYPRLGTSGLTVSRIARGCMSLGIRPSGCRGRSMMTELNQSLARRWRRASRSGTPPMCMAGQLGGDRPPSPTAVVAVDESRCSASETETYAR